MLADALEFILPNTTVVLFTSNIVPSHSLTIEHHYFFEKHVLSAVTVVSGRLPEEIYEEQRGKRGYDTFLTG